MKDEGFKINQEEIVKRIEDVIRKTYIEYSDAYEEDEIKNMLTSIKRKVEDALGNLFNKDTSNNIISDNDKEIDWDHYRGKCPVCDYPGMLTGVTEMIEGDDDSPVLLFFPESFYCKKCGLSLDNQDEVIFLGLDKDCNRTKELPKWFDDFGEDSYEKHKKAYKEFVKDWIGVIGKE